MPMILTDFLNKWTQEVKVRSFVDTNPFEVEEEPSLRKSFQITICEVVVQQNKIRLLTLNHQDVIDNFHVI